LTYADDVNILGGGVSTTENKKEALLFVSKETEVNVDKSQYTVMSRDQNAELSHNIKIDNSTFERVVRFKYSGTP
jgi:hypothetical protein